MINLWTKKIGHENYCTSGLRRLVYSDFSMWDHDITQDVLYLSSKAIHQSLDAKDTNKAIYQDSIEGVNTSTKQYVPKVNHAKKALNDIVAMVKAAPWHNFDSKSEEIVLLTISDMIVNSIIEEEPPVLTDNIECFNTVLGAETLPDVIVAAVYR